MMTTVSNDSSRFPIPFTPNQWQELEHQALVYKYMISGMPIPPDLIFSIKTSLDSSTKLLLHHQSPHQSIGWNCFQMGFGRKIDQEPGRCRRTDGKKWRCSREAYPHSKYCERHMHRGRNRSRKPVEPIPLSTICTKSPNYPSSKFHSSRSCGNVVSSQDQFFTESSEKDHSDTMNNSPSSLGQLKQRAFLDYQNDYSPTQKDQDQRRCYDELGLKIGKESENQNVMHDFFDESPQNGNDDQNKDKDSSTTRLSISTAHDFFNDK